MCSHQTRVLLPTLLRNSGSPVNIPRPYRLPRMTRKSNQVRICVIDCDQGQRDRSVRPRHHRDQRLEFRLLLHFNTHVGVVGFIIDCLIGRGFPKLGSMVECKTTSSSSSLFHSRRWRSRRYSRLIIRPCRHQRACLRSAGEAEYVGTVRCLPPPLQSPAEDGGGMFTLSFLRIIIRRCEYWHVASCPLSVSIEENKGERGGKEGEYPMVKVQLDVEG